MAIWMVLLDASCVTDLTLFFQVEKIDMYSTFPKAMNVNGTVLWQKQIKNE